MANATKSQATPGPWRTHDVSDGFERIAYTEVMTESGAIIACVYPMGSDNGARNANARLIAAAPQLRDALIELIAEVDALVADDTLRLIDVARNAGYKAARAALRAATGEKE